MKYIVIVSILLLGGCSMMQAVGGECECSCSSNCIELSETAEGFGE